MGAAAAAAPPPVPPSATVCVAGVALSVTVSRALRVPVALGVKVMLIAQFAPAASVVGSVPQVVVRTKLFAFVPLMAIELIESAALPVLESVTVCAALVVPVAWLAKVRLVAESVAAGPLVAVLPVPVSVIVCVVGVALSVTVIVALRVPVAVGLKVTLSVQLDPAGRLAGKVPQLFVCV